MNRESLHSVTRSSLQITFLLAVVTVLLSDYSLAQQPKSDPYRTTVEKLAKPLTDNQYVVGMSIGLIKDGKTYHYAFGSTSIKHKHKPNEGTLYEIGSISKTFTATLLAELVTQGKLSLKTTASSLLPKPNLNTEPANAITLVQLATHHSGLSRMPNNFRPADRLDPYADYTREQLYTFLAQPIMLSRPGEKYLYSNVASATLGHIISVHTQQPYNQLLKQRVFAPLDMKQSTVELSKQQREQLATPHNADGTIVKPWELGILAPAGGIRSNVNDMLKYAQGQLGKRKSKLDKAIELSHIKQERKPNGGMALAWHIARDGSTYWHNGQTGGYHCYFAFNKKHDLAVVILANTATGYPDRLGQQLVRMLEGKPTEPLKLTKVIKVPTKTLDRYVGKFAITPQFVLTVRRQDEHLLVQATNQPAFRVYPESPTEFHYRVVKATISFHAVDEKDSVSKVNKLILHQNGRHMTGKRVTQ